MFFASFLQILFISVIIIMIIMKITLYDYKKISPQLYLPLHFVCLAYICLHTSFSLEPKLSIDP